MFKKKPNQPKNADPDELWKKELSDIGSLDWEIQRDMLEEAQLHIARIALELRALYIKKSGKEFPIKLRRDLQRKALSLYVRFFWINIQSLRNKTRRILKN